MNSLSGEQCKPARGELRRSFMAEPLLSRRRRGDARGALLGAGNGLRSEDVQPVPLASDQASARPYAPASQQHARDSQPSAQAPAPAGEFWLLAEFDHLHTPNGAFGREAISQDITSEQRPLRLLSREWELQREVRILARLFTWVKKSGNVAAPWWPSISAAVSPCRGCNNHRPS